MPEAHAYGLSPESSPHHPDARHCLFGWSATGPVSALIGKYGGIAFGAQSISDEISNRADTYWSLALFGDVFERVRLDYVDPVSDKSLIEDALDGMLTGLDPHSGYMNAEAFQEMQAEDAGEFGGVGIEVTVDNGFLRVISAMDGSPAAKAGIKAGDLITTLDSKTVKDWPWTISLPICVARSIRRSR